MDDFKDLIHLVYLFKQLHGLGGLNILESYLNCSIKPSECYLYDLDFEIADRVIYGLFESARFYCNEDNGVSTYVLADKVMADYYLLSEEYGIRSGLSDTDNPYFKAANEEGRRWFGFSYNLGWRLEHKPESESPLKTKLVILLDEEFSLNLSCIAIGAAGMYSFFTEKTTELISLLSGTEKEAAAA